MKKKDLKLLQEAEHLIYQELEIRYESLEEELTDLCEYKEKEIDKIMEYIDLIMSDIEPALSLLINNSIEKLTKKTSSKKVENEK